MMKIRTAPLIALALVLSTHALQAQNRAHYRDFHLGGNVASVAALTRVPVSEVKSIHVRPAVIQELEWRPAYALSSSSASQRDPVQRVIFSFYNDQLFKLVINYDRYRTDGMTNADLVEALSATYGSPLKPAAARRPAASQFEDEFDTVVARWGDADSSVVLYKSSYVSAFRVVVTSPQLETLARTADAQAIKLDAREAPERELERQKKEAEDARASQEKARITNKAVFRP
jgi:hypothetical protein